MIYFDPTESRGGSRLPQTVIDQGHELPGLESATAADILISTRPITNVSALHDIDDDTLRSIIQMFGDVKTPILSNIAEAVGLPVPAIITARKLYASVQDGILIQRKAGSDLLNLISSYSRILMRMLIWTDNPWLLFIGNISCSSDGFAIIDKYKSGFHYSAIIGMLEAWQMGFQGYGGGFITTLSNDDQIASWLSRWLDKIRNEPTPRLVSSRVGIRPVIGEHRRWVQTLATFPGIGPERAKCLADHWGSLAACMEYLSDADEWKHEKVEGIGPGTVNMARVHLGFDGERDLRMVVEMKGVE